MWPNVTSKMNLTKKEENVRFAIQGSFGSWTQHKKFKPLHLIGTKGSENSMSVTMTTSYSTKLIHKSKQPEQEKP